MKPLHEAYDGKGAAPAGDTWGVDNPMPTG